MKPIDYIYKNLDSFNISIFKQIVEESGEEVSESIYDYLMETTWNTNPALLRQFGLDIERSSEDESDEWTTIMLEKMEITSEGQSQSIFGTNNPDDLAKMRELMRLRNNDGYPIIKMDYDIDYDSENHRAINMVGLAMTAEGMFGIISLNQGINLFYDYNNVLGLGEFVGTEVSPTETSYIKLYYKTGDYYTIFVTNRTMKMPVYVESNSSCTLQDIPSDKYYYSDGTNDYYNGDTIHFVDGMTLTFGQDSDGPIS